MSIVTEHAMPQSTFAAAAYGTYLAAGNRLTEAAAVLERASSVAPYRAFPPGLCCTTCLPWPSSPYGRTFRRPPSSCSPRPMS